MEVLDVVQAKKDITRGGQFLVKETKSEKIFTVDDFT